MDIQVSHEILKDSRGKIRYRKFKKGGYDHYYVRLFITGHDVEEVLLAEYELHPTFSNPLRTTCNPNDGFSVYIWTWGEFEVGVNVHIKNGKKLSFVYDLSYSNSLPLDDDQYADETPAHCRED